MALSFRLFKICLKDIVSLPYQRQSICHGVVWSERETERKNTLTILWSAKDTPITRVKTHFPVFISFFLILILSCSLYTCAHPFTHTHTHTNSISVNDNNSLCSSLEWRLNDVFIRQPPMPHLTSMPRLTKYSLLPRWTQCASDVCSWNIQMEIVVWFFFTNLSTLTLTN